MRLVGRTFPRATIEALIEALIEAVIRALDHQDGDENAEESEVDEDDLRASPSELSDGWSDDSNEE